jgi:hypothetical protein
MKFRFLHPIAKMLSSWFFKKKQKTFVKNWKLWKISKNFLELYCFSVNFQNKFDITDSVKWSIRVFILFGFVKLNEILMEKFQILLDDFPFHPEQLSIGEDNWERREHSHNVIILQEDKDERRETVLCLSITTINKDTRFWCSKENQWIFVEL